MNQLTHYQAKWSLDNPHLIVETNTSSVYRVQQSGVLVILKLLNQVGIHDEQRGARALHYYAGKGAAHLLAAAEDAHLLEYLDGDDLLPLVNTGHDDDAAHIIARVIKTLHQNNPKPIPEDLHTLRRRFRSLFDYAPLASDPLFSHGAQIAEQLLANQHNQVVLHGDIHHWNIKHSARGWLAFDPKGLYGENTYDVANALLNPISLPQMVQDEARLLRHITIYADGLGIPRDRIIAFAFAHACLSVSWSIEDGEDYDNGLIMARLLEKHIG
ncbi:MAG: aminoglycoside phosphotransferase family protein [Phototrophicaceae bacterium]